MNDDQASPKVFDTETLDSLKEAIGDAINHIVTVYLDDVPACIQNMREALSKKEYETVGRLAHSLKSSSANLGAMQTSAVAAELEKAMKEGMVEEKYIADSITKIEATFMQTRPMFINYIG